MTLTIDIPPHLAERLRRMADESGIAPEEYARRLLQTNLNQIDTDDATLALFAAWDAEDATDDPDELAARRRDWEEFKASMNAHHPSSRAIYP